PARAQRAPGRQRRPPDRQRRAAGRRPPPCRYPPGNPAHRPRHRLRPALARHRRRPQPGGVPWRHQHPRRRRRHRCAAVQQEPAAVGQRRDRHPAGAGDPRRRGPGRAWRHGGPARPQCAVLPALARRAGGPGPAPADRRVLPRAAAGTGRRRTAPAAARAPGRGTSPRPGQRGRRVSGAAAVHDGALTGLAGAVDWARVRADFPLLMREVHGRPLVYLDNANTSQKPLPVIASQDAFYRRHNANVSRAVHALGTEATEAYEAARTRLARFLNVRADELVLCSGTTFAINLVAYSWALPRLGAGDVILVSRMEHHANIVPWQLVAQRTGATIKVAEILPDGSLDLEALYRAMTGEVKLLAVTHVSNVLGTVNPVREICREARRRGITTVVDGSQAAPHMKLDVAAIGCDFYAVTGHKMCGPTGTGALWARRELLQEMPPFIGGGEMIREVSFEGTVFNDPPHRFEAGTPNIAGFVGLGVAIDYLD